MQEHAKEVELSGLQGHGMLDDEEFLALGRIAHAMLSYGYHAKLELDRWRWKFNRLSEKHKAMLPNMPAKIRNASTAVAQNAAVLKAIVEAGEEIMDIGPSLRAAKVYGRRCPHANPEDVSKVRYTLKNLVRDWSEEGAPEREQSYGWVVAKACALFPERPPAAQPSILVPGAGLARLPIELAGAGFAAVGNEFSYYMLLTSSFILNCTDEPRMLTVHPYVTNSCNQVADAAQLRGVSIPDRSPAEILEGRTGTLGVIAGDFAEVFAGAEHAAAFDAVATCFFIDTAHNVLEYMEVIYHCLKPEGFWINTGPLLYHWSSQIDEHGDPVASLELSVEDIKHAAALIGFTMLECSEEVAHYMGDAKGLYSTSYTCVRWVMQKPGSESATSAAE